MSKADSKPKSSQPSIGIALLFLAMGIGMMILVSVSPEGLNAPMWVVQIACSTFAFAGIAMLGQIYRNAWVTKLGGLGAVYGLCVPGLWIAFDPLPKDCSVTAAFVTTNGADWMCRGVFGIGAFITLACAVLMTISMLRRKSS